MVKYDKDVEFTYNIRPACLRVDVNDVPGVVEMITTGWGTIDAQSMHQPMTKWAEKLYNYRSIFFVTELNRSQVLLKVSVYTIPLGACNQSLVELNRRVQLSSLNGLSKSQLCAYNQETRADTCSGDSGGTLGSYHTQMYALTGITLFEKVHYSQRRMR